MLYIHTSDEGIAKFTANYLNLNHYSKDIPFDLYKSDNYLLSLDKNITQTIPKVFSLNEKIQHAINIDYGISESLKIPSGRLYTISKIHNTDNKKTVFPDLHLTYTGILPICSGDITLYKKHACKDKCLFDEYGYDYFKSVNRFLPNERCNLYRITKNKKAVDKNIITKHIATIIEITNELMCKIKRVNNNIPDEIYEICENISVKFKFTATLKHMLMNLLKFSYYNTNKIPDLSFAKNIESKTKRERKKVFEKIKKHLI